MSDEVLGKGLLPDIRVLGGSATRAAGRALPWGSFAPCVAQWSPGRALVDPKLSKLYNKSIQSSVGRCYLYIPR